MLFNAVKKILAVTIALAGIGLILWLDNWFMDHTDMPKLNQNMSYGLLLLVGALTGFHCVGMCGPLVVGYIAKDATSGTRSHLSHIQYGIGKTLSYTVIGGTLGAFGAVIAFTPRTQGLVGIAAGVFLILFGLHMLNAFLALRHFYIKPPAFMMRLVGREYRKRHNPLVIGLLNGLMIICGPLQAMYVMAAGSGSWAEGARIMFFFGLGTLPLLLGFGFLTSLVSANLTPKLLKASGVIVIILGTIMLNRGMALAGSGFDFNTLVARISTALAPSAAKTASCELEQTIRNGCVIRPVCPQPICPAQGRAGEMGHQWQGIECLQQQYRGARLRPQNHVASRSSGRRIHPQGSRSHSLELLDGHDPRQLYRSGQSATG